MTARENALVMLGIWIGASWLAWFWAARVARQVREWRQWRSIRRRARPDSWPFDWRESCPDLRQPVNFHVRRRR